eukprot:5559990-Alexandrium_andersonii.AAC.1
MFSCVAQPVLDNYVEGPNAHAATALPAVINEAHRCRNLCHERWRQANLVCPWWRQSKLTVVCPTPPDPPGRWL